MKEEYTINHCSLCGKFQPLKNGICAICWDTYNFEDSPLKDLFSKFDKE